MSFSKDLQASSAIRAGDYETAIEIYKRKLEEDHQDYFALSMLAHCHEWKKDMDTAIEYANRVLVSTPDDFSMLLLAARYWSSLKDEDKTYHYACRAVENSPKELPEIPCWIIWLFKPLSILPRFRNLEGRIKKDMTKHKDREMENLKWAKKYKKWYETKYGEVNEQSIH